MRGLQHNERACQFEGEKEAPSTTNTEVIYLRRAQSASDVVNEQLNRERIGLRVPNAQIGHEENGRRRSVSRHRWQSSLWWGPWETRVLHHKVSVLVFHAEEGDHNAWENRNW
jgi:hypothetical protein